jgi:hypothetical protein
VEPAAEVAWPGQALLASVQVTNGSLQAAVQAGTGDGLSVSEPAGEGLEEAGFLCQSEASCRIALSQRSGSGWTGGAIPFSLDVKAAALQPENELVLPVPAQDLGLYRGSLVVAGALGVGVVDPVTLNWTGTAVGPGLTAAQAVTPCGAYLCVARLGLQGLKVLDLTVPAQPQVKGSTLTLGFGWDVAASGSQVYLAHGILGVGVYTLDGLGQPTYRQTLWAGGVVRSVAVRQGVLAAARQGGGVKLFRLGETIQAAGTIQAPGLIDRVRFVGGRLWVLSKQGSRVDIYSVDDPDAPALLGSFTEDAAETFRSQWLGARVYTYRGHWLEAKHVTAVQP